jgi:hypothetical protein
MRQNSTDYSGERAPRRPCVIAQAGYTGKNYYAVVYRNQSITVRAGDELAAIFTAAKYWGYKWSAPEYHQNARALKLHYKPEFLIG